MTPEDDLTRARRVYVRALERAIRFRLELVGALENIERAERELKEGKHGDVAKSLAVAREELSGISRLDMQARIDGEVTYETVINPATHRFLGLWHPPVAPASPQELDCSAIICTCLEELTDGSQIRQHWETGCFDVPEFKTVPARPERWEDLVKELNSARDV